MGLDYDAYVLLGWRVGPSERGRILRRLEAPPGYGWVDTLELQYGDDLSRIDTDADESGAWVGVVLSEIGVKHRTTPQVIPEATPEQCAALAAFGERAGLGLPQMWHVGRVW